MHDTYNSKHAFLNLIFIIIICEIFQTINRDHVFWTSRDNTLSQVTPSYRRDLQSRRKHYDWHKIAVVPDVVTPLSIRREVVPFGCFAILALWILRRRRRLKHFLVATILIAMTGLIAIGKRVRRHLFAWHLRSPWSGSNTLHYQQVRPCDPLLTRMLHASG